MKTWDDYKKHVRASGPDGEKEMTEIENLAAMNKQSNVSDRDQQLTIQLVHLKRPAQGVPVQKFGLKQAQVVRHFHSSIPGYTPTPLVNLPNLAANLVARPGKSSTTMLIILPHFPMRRRPRVCAS
jgi:hypothetical protein